MENIAIIKACGKQYLVKENRYFKTDLIDPKSKEGDKIEFDEVLLTRLEDKITIGKPTIKNSVVEGTVKGVGKDKKIHVLRFHPKSNYHRAYGHRQPYMLINIDKIK